ADHAGCQDTRRSTSGSAQFLGDKLVSWSSKKQKSTAISTTEAKYIAMSKLIDIRHHFIREQVERGMVELYFVTTDYQLADIFTKALPRQRFEFILSRLRMKNKMADVNAPSGQAPAMAPPVRTDDQILPRIRWVPNGKSNCYLDLEKSQGNPIYKIVVDLLKNTNFLRAFTTSSTILSIYIQQFWDTVQYDKKAGSYKCQLDEQWRHKFYPRPDSPLHLPNEEPVLGYLKFSAKGTKREVFGMPIPGSLITADIQVASYYQEYLPTKPAKKPKSTALKAPPRPAVSTPVISAQPAPTSAPTKPQEKKRKQATKTSDKPSKAKKSKYSRVGKIRSMKYVAASKAEDVPAMEPQVAAEDTDLQKALEESMKIVYALPRGPLPPVVIREPESEKYQSLLEVPGKGKAKVTEEQVAHDLLKLQKPKKKSLADQYIFQRHVSEPTRSSGHDESPYFVLGQSDSEEELEKVMLGADEGGQSEHQAGPDPGAQAEGQTGTYAGAQDEGQAGSNPDETSEDQAGPDPGDAGAEAQSIPSPVVYAGSDREHIDLDVADVSPQPSKEQLDEGFTATAYPRVQENLKLAVEEQLLLEDPASSSGTLSSLQHLSKDISFEDLFFSDKPSDVDKNAETEVESMVNVSIQQALSSFSLTTSPIIDLTSRPESPKGHHQFKATTTDTTTTTTTLPPPQAQQQSTAEAMMIQRIGELKHIMASLIQVNKDMEERLDKHGARLYTLEQLDIPHQVSKAVSEVVADAVDWAMQAPLQNRFRDLPEADMKEILHQCMWETESYKTHEDHMQLLKALEKSMNRDHSEELTQDLAKARKKKKKSRESPKTPPGSPPHHPPPPPPPAGPFGASGAPGASGSSQVPPPPPPPSSTNQENLEMDEDMGPDEHVQLSDDEDIGSAHIPKVNLRQDWWKPFEEERPATPEPAWSIRSSDVSVPTNNWASALPSNYSPPPEDSLLAQTGDIATFMDWFCKQRGINELKPQDLEGPAFEIVKSFILMHNVSKPLPHGGLPGQVTIQSDFFFNKDLEYLRYSSKGRRPALSISKMKAAYYPDAGLEQMVPDQFWIEEECKYDIATMYGISHWWFQIQRFYIDRHTSEGDRRAVRTHMRILSVVRIEVFSMYGYDYMKKIVLRRADLNEHVIAERDFKYLYPSDFKDTYLLNLQGYLNHLPPKDKTILTTAVNQWTRHLVIRQRVEDFQLGIESYQIQLNLTKPQWDATGFEYKHDYTIIDYSRVVMFRDKCEVRMMMRFNEIHKFSDGTLQQIDEALDYKVKEIRINRMNPGLNTRFWTRKDVDRCKAFMFAIQRRLRTRRIFRNLESFVGGRVREGDYRLLKRTE
nr:copia protein [Tanacetum cinerariifolium]